MLNVQTITRYSFGFISVLFSISIINVLCTLDLQHDLGLGEIDSHELRL